MDGNITYNCKVEKHSEELDFILRDEVFGTEKSDEISDTGHFNHIYKGGEYENTPISIESLRKILDEVEKKGCNYVSIDYHCDHIEYDIYGLDIHESTKEEIEEDVEKIKVQATAKIEELKKEAQRYLDEVTRIENKYLK